MKQAGEEAGRVMGGKRGNFVANDFGLFCGFAVAKIRMQLGEMSWKQRHHRAGIYDLEQTRQMQNTCFK